MLRLVRSWSSPPDDPRQRRPTDILMLVGAGLLLTGIGFYYRAQGTVPAAAPSGSGGIVAFVDWCADFAYALVLGWALLLVVLPVFSRGRRRLLIDYVLGAVLTLAFGLLVSRPSSGGWTDTLRTILTTTPSPVDVVGPLALSVAVIVVAFAVLPPVDEVPAVSTAVDNPATIDLMDALAGHGWNVVPSTATYRLQLFDRLSVTMPPGTSPGR